MTFMLRIVNDPGAANGISDWALCPCQYCGYLLNNLLRHNGPFPTAGLPEHERPDRETRQDIAAGLACAGCWGGITPERRVRVGQGWYCEAECAPQEQP